MSVTEKEIEQAISNGSTNIEALKDNLKVAVTCGTCIHEVKEILYNWENKH